MAGLVPAIHVLLAAKKARRGCALAANTILARANAGEVPSFSLAFFRWMIVALGLAPFSVREIRAKWPAISSRLAMVAAAGFCGMFLCGGPV
jgi:hypothetical protein